MRLRWVVPPLAAAAALALSGCDIGFSSTEDNKTEQVAVTEIRINGGDGGGDVTVRPGPAGQAQIHRKIKYWGDEPSGDTYRIEGGTLYLDTGCGRRCDVSYDVRVPEGVKVSGDNGSGNVTLTGVSTVDIEVSSGNASVTRASGPVRVRVSSGNVGLSDIRGQLTASTSSGDIAGNGIRVSTMDLKATSGNITMKLASPADVTAKASSGDITLRVPAGASYQVHATTSSGEQKVGVPADPAGTYRLDLNTSSGNLTVTAPTAG
jgi:DUF4097 and DUF4098 domain-containing protein YvlB